MTAFYKQNEDGSIIKAENRVSTLNQVYEVANHEEYEYPIANGFFFFNSDEDAENYFNSGTTNGVPNSVTRMQALLALDAVGLLDDVEAMMSHPDTPRTTKIAFDNALQFRRTSSMMIGMASALGLDSASLDLLFINASKIEV
jgi:hypothetical protein